LLGLITFTITTTITNTMIERLIIIGLINSTEYLQQVRPVWDGKLISARTAQEISSWCIEFYDQYQKAPERNIEDVYYSKKDAKEIPIDMVEELEEFLEDLAGEYDETFNVQYALDQTNQYFKKRHLELYQDKLRELMRNGELGEAEALAASYKGVTFDLSNDLDLGKEEILHKVETIFQGSSDPLIRYPGKLGDMLNPHMIRGGFVSAGSSTQQPRVYVYAGIASIVGIASEPVALKLKQVAESLFTKPGEGKDSKPQG